MSMVGIGEGEKERVAQKRKNREISGEEEGNFASGEGGT